MLTDNEITHWVSKIGVSEKHLCIYVPLDKKDVVSPYQGKQVKVTLEEI